MIFYIAWLLLRWSWKMSLRLVTLIYNFLLTHYPTYKRQLAKLNEMFRTALKALKAMIHKIKININNLWIKLKNFIMKLIKSTGSTEKPEQKINSSFLIGVFGSTAAAIFITRHNSTGPVKTFLQITVFLILLGLYQILIFFQKMYSLSKWTTEAARFTKILVQAFWVLEFGTYVLFTYLMSTRPQLTSYGFAHFVEVTTSQLTPLILLNESLLLSLTLFPLLLLKLVKKFVPKEVILLLFGLTFHYTFKTFYAELTQLLILSTWVEIQQINLLSENITSLNTAQSINLTNTKPLLEHLTTLEVIENTHESYTSLFYSLVLISLKVFHSVFILMILLVVILQYIKTSELSFSLVSILVLNAIFLYAFSIASAAPTLIDELSLYSSQITAPYEGVNRGPSLDFVTKNATNS